jgi:uncharacterized RDD family membrane protein YckC
MRPDRGGVEGVPLAHSPEQVVLELSVAGPTSRMLAYVVDYVLMLIVAATLAVGLVMAAPALWSGLLSSVTGRLGRILDEVVLSDAALVLLGAMLLVTLYAMEIFWFVFWDVASGGRSPGKRLVGLRVVRDGGLPITFGASLVRNLLRVADALPVSYVVGLIAMVASPSGKRLGDMAAGTLVIRLDRPPAVAELPAAPEASVHAFRFDRTQAARLGPDETSLARETLRRVAALDPDGRERVLATATDALVARLGCAPVEPERQEAFLHAVLDATKLR